jgi:amino acid adenylation domain-containing protein
MAKYFASRAAVSAACDAVQIMGAAGCHGSSPVSRFYRDAKIMEIIEGTTQIHEDLLGKIFVGQAQQSDLARIAGFNRTEAPFPDDVTLQELFEAQVARNPSASAVYCDHDKTLGAASLSYGALNDRVNRLAHRLRAEGVRPGDVVALMVDRSFAMIIGILGIIKAGGAYLPLPPDNPPERNAYMLQDAAVRVLLVQDRTVGRVAFAGRVISLDDAQVYRGSTANPALVNKPDDLAYVIYTSGSTGKPKGVMIEHRSVVNRLHWMQRAYPLGENDVILQKTPYSFDVSVWELFWWALQGAKVSFLAPGGERNPLAIVEAVRRRQVSVMHFVPSMLNVFVEYLDGKPAELLESVATVRRVFASGEALMTSHVRRFNTAWGGRTGARLVNLYGPTEATVDVSAYDCPAHGDFDSIPIGRPIDNTRFYVIRDGRQAAIGEAGELCIAGIQLARGYLNNPALTAQKFTDNPVNPGERIYRTGDVARWLPDGIVEYLGREDHQVKIRGLRIELGEIENAMREFPGVVDCVARVARHSETVVLIVAYVVWKAGEQSGALKEHLKRHLPDYMIPNRFETLEAIPLTASGKADRKALPERVG